MNKSLDIAQNILLNEHGLGLHHIQDTLDDLLLPSIDQADIYFQSTQSECWALEEGIVKEGAFNIDQGVGIRAISGEKTGFAYADEIVLPALKYAANAVRAIGRQGTSGTLKSWEKQASPSLYSNTTPLSSISTEEKIALLQRIDKTTKSKDPRVKQVFVRLSGRQDTILVADNEGRLAADVRPLISLNISVIVEHNGRIEKGGAGGGGRFDYRYFLDDELIKNYIDEATDQALTNLDAIEAPAGTMQVVLGPGWPGILLHEAVGHGLEGDFNRKKTSAFTGRIGEQVAAPGVTVVDDGTIKNRRGSLNIDDEGTPTSCTTLIEDGILKGYMQDKHNARLMNTVTTGNGRRQSYAHLPMPRMTNTYMLGGKYTPEEIIASVNKGIYATQFGGGQVDITNGQFIFNADQAWLIEKGKLTHPVKGAAFIGNGPEALKQVSMIGNDMRLDSGIGTCGKDGQSVPVGVGQPTIRIDALTVGGTNTTS